jgi:hypothetical protein
MSIQITDEGRARLAVEIKRMVVFSQFWIFINCRKGNRSVEDAVEDLHPFVEHLIAHIAMGLDPTPDLFENEWQRQSIFIDRNQKFMRHWVGEIGRARSTRRSTWCRRISENSRCTLNRSTT